MTQQADRRRQDAAWPGAAGRCLVMGIVNATPDSFSDGGRHRDADDAVRHGVQLIADGADIIDVGGESTRPRAGRTPVEEELRRVLPVVRGLAQAGVPVSIDTTRARVAAAAVEAGAVLVNDVSGGLADPAMPPFVAEAGVGYVAMHWRGHSAGMAERARYRDVVAEVVDELERRLEALVGAGIPETRIVLDPGLGFAKTAGHSWAVLNGFDRILALGRPVLVGASRKSFLDRRPAVPGDVSRTPGERDPATVAVSALAAAAGAYCVRVHDVATNRQAVEVAEMWTGGRGPVRATPGVVIPGVREPGRADLRQYAPGQPPDVARSPVPGGFT